MRRRLTRITAGSPGTECCEEGQMKQIRVVRACMGALALSIPGPAALLFGALLLSGPGSAGPQGSLPPLKAAAVLVDIADLLANEPGLPLPVRQCRDGLYAYYQERKGGLIWIGTGRMAE